MITITVSRQYGSGGDEIAARVCEMLEYRYFDKKLMAQVAVETGLSENEVIDFSEDNYKIRSFLDHLFIWRGPRTVTQVHTWKEGAGGARVKEVAVLNEIDSITLVRSAIEAAYKRGNTVIVGRGGQAILREMPDVFHVRIEAPLDIRAQRIETQEGISLGAARDMIIDRDRAAQDYLKRFYDIDWADPMLYDLIINTRKLDVETATHLIVNAVSSLPTQGEII